MHPSLPPRYGVVRSASASYAPPAVGYGGWAPPPPPRLETKAVAALVLGLLAFVLGPLTGVAAIVLGAVARRDIDRSSGALGGQALAAGGIVAGLFGMGFVLVVVLGVCDTILADRGASPATASTVRAEVAEPRR